MDLQVQELDAYQNLSPLGQDYVQKQAEKIKLEYKPDTFEKTYDPNNKSNNGKFDLSECIKNFGKGLISPLTAIFEHPLMTLGIVAGTAALCTLIPVMTPIMGIGFGALSVYQLGKGVYDVAKNCKNKDYDKAEKSFNEVGQGTVGIILTALGLKQGAKAAKEAKLMSELGANSLSVEQKAQIAKEVSEASNMQALKEIGSLFTSKAGWKAVGAQFKPSNISKRATDAFRFLFKKEEVKTVEKKYAQFQETAEGKRRAAMTTEEIEAKVKALYKEACDEYGIPEELRPEIEVYKNEANPRLGGGYNSTEHKITINETSYREGYFDLPNTIKHETTHAREAILRQRLPMEQKEQLAMEYFLDKIQNGDSEEVLVKFQRIGGVKTKKPPVLNEKMKADFSKLAKEKLYQPKEAIDKFWNEQFAKVSEDEISALGKKISKKELILNAKTSTPQYSFEELQTMVRPIVESNPEFVSQYSSTDEAVKAMAEYAQSHVIRYNRAIEFQSGFSTKDISMESLPKLSEAETKAAAKSFMDGIACGEGNTNKEGFLNKFTGKNFNQYQFTPEEVLAQQRGNNFEIAKLKSQLKNLRATENYDIAEEARILDQIKKCELTIEYKTKGQEMYQLYTQSINNPENKELAQKVAQLQEELKSIEIDMGEFGNRDYSVNITYRKPPMGASVGIPYTTTNSADIIADNLKK